MPSDELPAPPSEYRNAGKSHEDIVLTYWYAELGFMKRIAEALEAREATAQPEPAEDTDTGSEGTQRLTAAFNQAGFQVRDIQANGEGYKFKLGHEDFDELKRVTSQCDMVEYDGEHNVLEAKHVPSYIGDVLGVE